MEISISDAVREDKEGRCKHPPERQFAWHAADGTLCVGCCECGAVLMGGAEPATEKTEA